MTDPNQTPYDAQQNDPHQPPPQQEPPEPFPGDVEGPPPIEQNSEARNMGMLCHLLAIFTGFIGPLIIWLIKKEEHPFVDHQGKEALNFEITVLIAALVLGIITCGVGAPIVMLVGIIFNIIATVDSSKGHWYRYPLAIRLLK
ncbi:MAG: DUF4870 domain-containing protein [Planctomycetota bacterium]